MQCTLKVHFVTTVHLALEETCPLKVHIVLKIYFTPKKAKQFALKVYFVLGPASSMHSVFSHTLA